MTEGFSSSLKRFVRHLSGASLGPIAEFGLRFARTVALSRLLLPIDLGACIALGAVLSGSYLTTDLGLEKYVVVFGREAPVLALAAARQISIIRGFLVGLVLVIFAPAIGNLFGGSVNVDTIRWLAVASIFSGFRNWRVIQLQLEYKFGPQAISIALAQTGALMAALLAAIWLHDERVMLISLIAEAAVYTIASHCVVSRKRVGPVDSTMRQLVFSYGLPLMANGVALWALNQLDRIVVVNVFGSATLALYSLATGLATLPISVLTLVAANLAFPYLERGRRGLRMSAQEASFNVMFGHFVAAAAYSMGIAVLIERIIPLFYGAQYKISSLFAILLSLFVFLRVARNGVNTILLANNGTVKLTVGNLCGGSGPLLGLAVAMVCPRIESVALGLVIGDLISLVALLLLARRELPSPGVFALAGLFGAPVALVLVALDVTHGGTPVWENAVLLAIGAMAVLASSAVAHRWRLIRL